MPNIKVAIDRCKGCGLCIHFCPTKYLEFSSALNIRGVRYPVSKKNGKCSGCKVCMLVCPDVCIEWVLDEAAKK